MATVAESNDLLSEFTGFCDRLRRNDVRTKVLDQEFYFRFCSLVLHRENAELVTMLANSIAENTSLEELTLDGGILFRHENAENHLEAAKTHLRRNKRNLQHLTLRWCGESLLEAAAESPSLKSITMNLQKAIDVENFLSGTNSIESLKISTSSSVVGLGAGISTNHSLKKLELLITRFQDEDMASLCTGLISKRDLALSSLQLKVYSLAQLKSLQDFLKSSTCKLEVLDLSRSDLRGEESQIALLEGLSHNCSLRRLVLDQCSLGKSGGLAPLAWIQAFEANRSMQELSFVGNFLEPSDFETLVQSLARSPGVQSLNLELNLIPSEVTRLLSNALMLTGIGWNKLSLSGIEVSSLKDANVLKEALVQNESLNDLKLGSVWVTAEQENENKHAVKTIAEGIIGNRSLKRISIEGFGTEAEDVRDLMIGLASKSNVRSLVLRRSKFSASVCDNALRELISSNTSLVELDLESHESFEKSTVRAIADGVAINKTIKTFRLFQCKVDDCDWSDLLKALEANSSVECLDLRCRSPKEADGKAIFECFCQSLPNLKGLKEFIFHDVGGYLPDQKNAARLLAALEKNHCLERVSIDAQAPYAKKTSLLLELNKFGRRLLPVSDGLSPALWSVAFATMAASRDGSELFYCLRRTVDKWSEHTSKSAECKMDRKPLPIISHSHPKEYLAKIPTKMPYLAPATFTIAKSA